MLFNSATYLLFLPSCVAIFWALPRGWRVHFLVVASYVFYATWSPPYALMMFGLVVFNWTIAAGALRIAHLRQPLLTFGIVVDLLILGLFKYYWFVADTIAGSLRALGIPVGAPPEVDLILPLGISFFTFEFIHFLVDARRSGPLDFGFSDFHVFSAFFPTQIAGPIKRLQDFLPQLHVEHRLSLLVADEAIQMIVVGLFKKMALADNLAVIADAGFSRAHDLTFLDAWTAVVAFAFQIYFDFSGYTDIARGSALLFGFRVPVNFRQPYMARNVSEFWERWHISLSSWLRDYLFIPLGGSRVSPARASANLLTTMLLGGLWHGAAWNFVVWGGYWGVGLVLYHHWRRHQARAPGALRALLSSRLTGTILTMLVVLVGWVFFRAPLANAFAVLAAMAAPAPGFNVLTARRFGAVIAVGAAYYAWLVVRASHAAPREARVQWLRAAGLAALLLVALVADPSDNPAAFIYFQF